MSEERAVGEQSMEDILASIRRIISDEDDEPVTDARRSLDDAVSNASTPPQGNDDVEAEVGQPAKGATGQQPDDLSDILEPRRPSGAQIEPVSSFGERPKAASEPVTAVAESSAAAGVGDGKSVSARLERPASLTERLAVRERMASLDLKRRTAEAILKTDVEPVARREAAQESPATKSFPAIELDGPEPVKPSVERAAVVAKLPEPKVDVAPKTDAPPANEARGKAAEEVLTRPRFEKPALVDGEAAVVGADSKGAIGQTPRPAAVPGEQKSPVSVSKEAALSSKSNDVAEPEVKAVGAASAPEVGSGPVIPSSVAVGVGALNKADKAAGSGSAEPAARKSKHGPSPALVEAAREALHDDEPSDETSADTSETSKTKTSPTLEEVVHAALQPVLKSWLDENLPRIIEKQVREEVQRAMASAKRTRAG
jgi:cell pole-organizing protein PopZ